MNSIDNRRPVSAAKPQNSQGGLAPKAAETPRLTLQLHIARWLARRSFSFRWRYARLTGSLNLQGDPVFRELVTTNIAACFPEESLEFKIDLVRQYAKEHCFCLLDRLRVWSLSEAEVRDQIELIGAEYWDENLARGPVVLLCPHFMGLEAAAQRLAVEKPGMTIYRPSKDPAFEALRWQARQRFNAQHLVPLGAPLLPVIRRLIAGTTLFLLPDLDAGASGTFVPFFGVPASTSRTAAWCALRTGAKILPMSVTHVGQGRYSARINPPMPPLPSDLTLATEQISAVMEALIRGCPSQYWWAQGRFMTRPPGTTALYSPQLQAKMTD
jgi:Kdo2-lipid IVA lauroyltransferase/acyltransferase